MGDSADEANSENHKHRDLTPVDSLSVPSFFSELYVVAIPLLSRHYFFLAT